MRVQRWFERCSGLLVVLAMGCGGSSSDGATDADVVGTDAMDTVEVVVADLGVVETVAVCPGMPEQPFPLFPDAPPTQIHAAAAWDGDGIWMVFNMVGNPEAEDKELGVFAAKIACDGSLIVSPVRLDTPGLGNSVDPDLALSPDGGIAAIWQTDTGVFPVNLHGWVRVVGADGNPVDEPQAVATWTGGVDTPASLWMTRIAALPDAGFRLAASWAFEEAGAFQVVLQDLDASGHALGGAVPGTPADLRLASNEPGVTQLYPALAVLPDGRGMVAWTATGADDVDRVVFTPLSADGLPLASPPALAHASLPGTGAALATSQVGDGRAYLAFGTSKSRSDIWLRDATVTATDARGAFLGSNGEIDHSPVLAVGEGGGAVLWYRVRSGIRNDVLIQRFADDGTTITVVGNARVLNDTSSDEEGAPGVYGPALTRVSDDVYFAAWSEGPSPDFRLVGRFVRFE